jgi:hypothetical protein
MPQSRFRVDLLFVRSTNSREVEIITATAKEATVICDHVADFVNKSVFSSCAADAQSRA